MATYIARVTVEKQDKDFKLTTPYGEFEGRSGDSIARTKSSQWIVSDDDIGDFVPEDDFTKSLAEGYASLTELDSFEDTSEFQARIQERNKKGDA